MLSLNSVGLEVNNKKLYSNISMSFLPSSIVYLKGHNGSGKTSLLRMIAGLIEPTNGNISFTKSSAHHSMLAKPYCTYIGHNIAIKSELTVLENLAFWAKLYNGSELVPAALFYFSLADITDKKCSELSAGNRKKLALAKLLCCPSKLWLLDEVDSNLDDNNKKLLHNIIISHADNGGVTFIASHNEPEIKTAQILDLDNYGDE